MDNNCGSKELNNHILCQAVLIAHATYGLGSAWDSALIAAPSVLQMAMIAYVQWSTDCCVLTVPYMHGCSGK